MLSMFTFLFQMSFVRVGSKNVPRKKKAGPKRKPWDVSELGSTFKTSFFFVIKRCVNSDVKESD